MLLIISGAGAWFDGYFAGLRNSRSHAVQLIFPILIAVVITLVSDIDSPDKSWVGVSQQPLIDLYKSMKP